MLEIHYEKPCDFKLRMLLLLNERRYQGASFGIRTLFIYANFGHKKLRPNHGLNPEITSLLWFWKGSSLLKTSCFSLKELSDIHAPWAQKTLSLCDLRGRKKNFKVSTKTLPVASCLRPSPLRPFFGMLPSWRQPGTYLDLQGLMSRPI